VQQSRSQSRIDSHEKYKMTRKGILFLWVVVVAAYDSGVSSALVANDLAKKTRS